MKTRSVARLAAVAGTLILISSAAYALPTIRFDNPNVDGGSIFYDGNGGALQGTDIIFGNIIGTDTPANNGAVLECRNCLLNFTTGSNTSEPAGGNGPWVFDSAGSSIVLSGQIFNGGTQIFSGSILEGVLTAPATVTRAAIPERLVVSLLGSDDKVSELLNFYGITDPSFDFVQTTIDFGPTIGANFSIDGVVDDADLVNQGKEVSAIPEPATLGLIGLGLVALGAVGRRRISA